MTTFERRLRVVLVLKTNHGCMWTTPHVDALLARGHQVVAVLPRGDGHLRRALLRRDVSVVDSPFDFRFRPSIRTLMGLVRLRRTFRALAPDVLHYHLFASALAVRLAGVALPAARVHMVAGPLHLESRLIRAVERFMARMDTVTICGSDHTARRYRALGRSEARTPVVPYGVDTRRFRPAGPGDGAEVREMIGADEQEFIVVMVALVYAPKRLVHAGRGIKGHDVLLAAWQRFHADHLNSRLLLVGGGVDDAGTEHRRELIARFRVDEDPSVTWLNSVDDVRPYYAAADLSVSPSLSDNHGAVLEASAMGVPSVVSDAGALPEAVDRGVCWVVPSDDPDALATALHEAHAAHLRGDLAERSDQVRDRAARYFDSRRAAALVADVIEETAAETVRCGRSGRLVSLFTEMVLGRDRAAAVVAGAAYAKHGRRLQVVARSDGESGVEDDDLTPRPLPLYRGPAGLVRALPRLVPAVVREVSRAEVVVLHQPGAIGAIAAVACKLSRRDYAVEVVGDPFDVLAAGTLGRVGRAAARPARVVMRWIVRGASAVRYVTGSALQRRYPAGRGRFTVGVSDVCIGPGSLVEQPRTWSPGPFTLVAVGSHEQLYKGHDVLLRAVRRLVEEGLDVRAVVVGAGRRHTELVALARSLDLGDRVHFTGHVSDRGRVTELLDAADLFVMPSRAEGLPRALVEAMARALPAVATRVGGIPELLEPGCLVDVGDDEALARVVHRLLTDPDTWEHQSSRNLERAREYDAARLSEQFSTWVAHLPSPRQAKTPIRRTT